MHHILVYHHWGFSNCSHRTMNRALTSEHRRLPPTAYGTMSFSSRFGVLPTRTLRQSPSTCFQITWKMGMYTWELISFCCSNMAVDKRKKLGCWKSNLYHKSSAKATVSKRAGQAGTILSPSGDCVWRGCGHQPLKDLLLWLGIVCWGYSLNLQNSWVMVYPCLSYGLWRPSSNIRTALKPLVPEELIQRLP